MSHRVERSTGMKLPRRVGRLDEPRKPREELRKLYKNPNRKYRSRWEYNKKKGLPTRRQEIREAGGDV